MMGIKSVAVGLFLIVLAGFLFIQSTRKKTETIYIQTSAICGECKKIIEPAVANLKGVKHAELNLEDKKLMVEYIPTMISDNEIREAVSMTGFDADEVKGQSTSYEKLPTDCQESMNNP